MANKIETPAITNPMTLDWQTLLVLNAKINGAFFIVNISSNNAAGPQILKGSRFEINQSFFEVVDDPGELVPGFSDLPVDTYWYIYAVPQGDYCSFTFDVTAPSLDVQKGGLFNGANRCIGQIKKLTSSTYELTIAGPSWYIPMRGVNPLHFDNSGMVKFSLPVGNLSSVAQDGDMWLEVT